MSAGVQADMAHYRTSMSSPVGTLTLVATEAALVAIRWGGEGDGRTRLASVTDAPDHPILAMATAQLAAYFAGARTVFDLPLAPSGTPFQQAVWLALITIPFGETRSYADIATAIGRPTATRAVGAANGRNPLPIVAPCHRVIGANGSLTGFGGGLANKRILLDLERRDLFA